MQRERHDTLAGGNIFHGVQVARTSLLHQIVMPGCQYYDSPQAISSKKISILMLLAYLSYSLAAIPIVFAFPTAFAPHAGHVQGIVVATPVLIFLAYVGYCKSKSARFICLAGVAIIYSTSIYMSIALGSTRYSSYLWCAVGVTMCILNGVHRLFVAAQLVIIVVLSILHAIQDIYQTPSGVRVVHTLSPAWIFVIGSVCTIIIPVFAILMGFAMKLAEAQEWQYKTDRELVALSSIKEVMDKLFPPIIQQKIMNQEKLIVFLVHDFCCTFIDIHNFTALTNNVDPDFIPQMLNYVFGIMDLTAEYFGLLKIKTIGDCYMSFSSKQFVNLHPSANGLSSLAVTQFLTTILQVFSVNTEHLNAEGAILQICSAVMSGMSEDLVQYLERNEGQSTQPSWNDYSNKRKASTANEGEAEKIFLLRAGAAMGPTTVGVLTGKVPQLDAWGIYVNLASRMESNSFPGFAQISKAIYDEILQVPWVSDKYKFSAPHHFIAKGFGQVEGRVLMETSYVIPEDLRQKLDVIVNDFRYFGGFGNTKVHRAKLPELE